MKGGEDRHAREHLILKFNMTVFDCDNRSWSVVSKCSEKRNSLRFVAQVEVNFFSGRFLADRTLVTVELQLSWLSSVCLSVCLSVTDVLWLKRCKIGPMLLLITNRKSHTGFQMTYKSMTLDDLEGS